MVKVSSSRKNYIRIKYRNKLRAISFISLTVRNRMVCLRWVYALVHFLFLFSEMSTTFLSLHKNEINCSFDIGVDDGENHTWCVRQNCLFSCFAIFTSIFLVRGVLPMAIWEYNMLVASEECADRKQKNNTESKTLFSLYRN